MKTGYTADYSPNAAASTNRNSVDV